MPIKLNPCRVCGCTRIITDTDELGQWATGCTLCDNYEEGGDDEDSQEMWNAANTKEDAK